jgi:hypothetical protein
VFLGDTINHDNVLYQIRLCNQSRILGGVEGEGDSCYTRYNVKLIQIARSCHPWIWHHHSVPGWINLLRQANKVQYIPWASKLTIQISIIATNAESAEMWKMKYHSTRRVFHLKQFEYLDGLMTELQRKWSPKWATASGTSKRTHKTSNKETS